MNRMAANVRQEKQVDLTGSYRKLGGAARGWYEEYQERGEKLRRRRWRLSTG